MFLVLTILMQFVASCLLGSLFPMDVGNEGKKRTEGWILGAGNSFMGPPHALKAGGSLGRLKEMLYPWPGVRAGMQCAAISPSQSFCSCFQVGKPELRWFSGSCGCWEFVPSSYITMFKAFEMNCG